MISQLQPPRPAVDTDSAPWWDGLRRHMIVLQRCVGCGRFRFPPMPGCPYCGAADTELVDSPHSGSLYTWIVVRHPFDPCFADDIPYIVAMVDLDDGVRIPARVEGDADITAGTRVTAAFVDHDDWTELRFRTLAAETSLDAPR